MKFSVSVITEAFDNVMLLLSCAVSFTFMTFFHLCNNRYFLRLDLVYVAFVCQCNSKIEHDDDDARNCHIRT